MLRETTVENGRLRGLPGADPRVSVYKGIPFAAPPVGERRWKAPAPCESWEGTRTAYEFGPISYQNTPGIGDMIYNREWHVDPEIPMSEDCLYLNVYTPAKKTDEKLPVLLWYFGGGFQWGYTAEMEFDGEQLAKRGVIVVSAAYRLNVFGFMAHSLLTAESPEAPANFGLLDQQAALRWVNRNIAAFGGDPDRITIAGQSAGGSSVMHQLTCRQNYDLLSGAVVFSGMIRNPKETSDIFRPLSLPDAEKKGADFFEFLGVSTLEEARAIDSKTLLAKYDEFAKTHQRMFPICDGKFCENDPMERFVNGDCAPVPVISGNTSDEFADAGNSIVELSVKSAFLDADKKGSKQNHYYYRFDPDIPGDGHPGDSFPGTFHSVDLWFFFDSIAKSHRFYKGRHFDLAARMCDMFANFIKTGDPNGCGRDGEPLPLWRPYTAEDPAEMEFTGYGPVLRPQGGIRLGITGKKQAVNPYLPCWEYVPDGEPYVFNGRVYVYGSHDRFGSETFCQNDYICYSAPVNDLGNWHYEGVIYRKDQDPLNKDGKMVLFAPDVTVGPDGRYYLYYVLDGVNVVSVAVCDTPAGQYEFYGYVHYADGTKLGDREGDEPQFDPGVLTEDGKTYLFTGFCNHGDKTRHGSMLTVLDSDMLTILKDPKIVVPGKFYSEGSGFEGHAFFEASSIRKRGDIYYFIYSSEVMHELCYATSKDPEGPYVYGGVIVSNCDIGISSYKEASLPAAYGANNHGSMVQIGDLWYIFYHRHTNGGWYCRQGCAEKLTFREDGSILQAEITSCGLNDGPLTDIGEYPAYIACNIYTEKRTMYVEGTAPAVTQRQADGEPGESYIRNITDGTVIGFKYFAFDNVKGLKIRTRAYYNGCFEVRTAPEGEVLGKITGKGSHLWETFSCEFAPVSGTNALYLTYRGTGSPNLRSIEFVH